MRVVGFYTFFFLIFSSHLLFKSVIIDVSDAELIGRIRVGRRAVM